MKKLPFKANGHLANLKDGDLANVFNTELNPPGYEDIAPFISNLSACANCGDRMALQITDDAVTVRDPCPCPDGVTSVIILAVPSGKIIVADDLRPVYDWNDEDMADYNSALGQSQAVQAMAAAGCAYGPVGNSCPGLYRTGENTYVIANPGYNEETDEEVLPKGWELLAGIVTDLWAYSIADFVDWASKGGDPGSLGRTSAIVDVPPGTYQFTHHSGEAAFDRDAPGTVIFTHIERIRKS